MSSAAVVIGALRVNLVFKGRQNQTALYFRAKIISASASNDNHNEVELIISNVCNQLFGGNTNPTTFRTNYSRHSNKEYQTRIILPSFIIAKEEG